MSTKTESLAIDLDEQRSRLERRGNVIRSRLIRAIDALDNRRHHVQEIVHDAKRLAIPIAGSLFGVVVIAAGTTFAIRAHAQPRRKPSFSYRLAKALAPFRVEPKPSFWQDALRKVALTIIGVVATEVATHGARALLGSRDPGDPVPLRGPGGGAV